MSMHVTCDINSKTSRNTAHTSLSCLCNCRQDGGSGGGLMNDIWESAKVVFVWEWGELVGTFDPLHSLCIKETDQRRRLNSLTRRGRSIGHHVRGGGPCLSNFLSWVHKLGRIFSVYAPYIPAGTCSVIFVLHSSCSDTLACTRVHIPRSCVCFLAPKLRRIVPSQAQRQSEAACDMFVLLLGLRAGLSWPWIALLSLVKSVLPTKGTFGSKSPAEKCSQLKHFMKFIGIGRIWFVRVKWCWSCPNFYSKHINVFWTLSRSEEFFSYHFLLLHLHCLTNLFALWSYCKTIAT